MRRNLRKSKQANGKTTLTTTISMPPELYKQIVAQRVKGVPEMNFSKHMRALSRKDLEAAGA